VSVRVRGFRIRGRRIRDRVRYNVRATVRVRIAFVVM
jgi:hypothetical protein